MMKKDSLKTVVNEWIVPFLNYKLKTSLTEMQYCIECTVSPTNIAGYHREMS